MPQKLIIRKADLPIVNFPVKCCHPCGSIENAGGTKKNKKPQNSSAEVILVAQAVYGFSPGGSRVTAVAVNTQTKKIHT